MFGFRAYSLMGAAAIGASVLMGGLGFVGATQADELSKRVAFPEGYASTFKNYLSLDRTGNDDQIIRLFANETAVKAAQAGEPLPDGSVLVGEIYKARKSEAGEVIESSLGRRVRDKFAAVAVMEKRSGWGRAFPDDLKNGDWDFAIFSPSGERLAGKDVNSCRSCHAPLKDSDHMFSYEHLSAK
ncbi:MAG: cytochrome P460 family protein [Pseudomonadota bacterium]